MNNLPVLMYHSIIPGNAGDNMHTGVQQLAAQFEYLAENGYTTISMQMLTDHIYHQTALPPKPVLITFDDGYRDNLHYLAPLLVRYQFKATIFIVPFFVTNHSGPADPYMNMQELKALQAAGAELGYHTFAHESYATFSEQDVQNDLCKCRDWVKQSGLSFVAALAYTYGAYPRKTSPRQQLLESLKNNGFNIAFRIGNRLNTLPVKSPYFMQRIDIKGTDSLAGFKRKVQKGGRRWF